MLLTQRETGVDVDVSHAGDMKANWKQDFDLLQPLKRLLMQKFLNVKMKKKFVLKCILYTLVLQTHLRRLDLIKAGNDVIRIMCAP